MKPLPILTFYEIVDRHDKSVGAETLAKAVAAATGSGLAFDGASVNVYAADEDVERIVVEARAELTGLGFTLLRVRPPRSDTADPPSPAPP